MIRRGTVRSRECRRSREMAATDIVRRAWSQLPPTIWKKPLWAASAANWNKRAWPEAAKRNRCNKSCAARKKWAATIPAPAAPARNSKSATARKVCVGRFMWGRAPRPSSRAQRGAFLLRVLAGLVSGSDGFERHLYRLTLRSSLPLQKQSCIIRRNVIRPLHAELLRRSINPSRRALNFAEISNRRFVHHDLPFAIRPLGSKLLVAERRRIS